MTAFDADAPRAGPTVRSVPDIGSVPAGATRAPPPDTPAGPGLASLRDEAHEAGLRLGAQPLPIANRDMLLIQKLFGG